MVDPSTAREARFAPSNPAHARRALTVLRLHFEDFGHDTILDDDLFASDLARLVANCPDVELEARHLMTALGIEPEWFDEQLDYFRDRPGEAAVFPEHESEGASYRGLRSRDMAMIALLAEAEGGPGSACFLRLDSIRRMYYTPDESLFAYY